MKYHEKMMLITLIIIIMSIIAVTQLEEKQETIQCFEKKNITQICLMQNNNTGIYNTTTYIKNKTNGSEKT